MSVCSIDLPTPFAPKAGWQAHLEELRELGTYNGSPELHAAIAEAEALLGGKAEAAEPAPFPDPKTASPKLV